MTDETVRRLRGVGAAGSSLPEILAARTSQSPDDRFLTFGTESWSFAQMHSWADAAAAGLYSLGVRRGDRVALMLPNCPEFLALWFGASLIGAVFVPINAAIKGDGLAYIVNHSSPLVAVVDDAITAEFDSAVPLQSRPTHTLVRGTSRGGWRSVQDLFATPDGTFSRVMPDPGDPSSILYTSGTTGPPKGVVNCHNAYVVAGYEFAQNTVRARPDDVFYTSLPLFHVNAQMLTTIGALVSGRPMVLASRFSGSNFITDVRNAGATVFNYIGAMLTIIAKQPPSAADTEHRVRLAVGGAAPANVWPAFENRFGLSILEIYGLTETATFCLANPPDDIRVGRIGKATSWSEVKVVSADGYRAPAGKMGEIVVRSKRPDVVFKEYLDNPEATAAAFTDGWFHTGDRGFMDEDGYFAFVDRQKDCIRRRGENISSYDVESVVNTHPSVARSAAVGVPSDLGEEDVMIVVVPRPGDDLNPADLVSFCSTRMAAFMVPRYVRIRDTLPVTATERVQKYALRAEGILGAWDSKAPVTA